MARRASRRHHRGRLARLSQHVLKEPSQEEVVQALLELESA
jgi:hypothetical protein